jgi:hypothetical protein
MHSKVSLPAGGAMRAGSSRDSSWRGSLSAAARSPRGIRQHTSAYVSIRQHTSAYGSIAGSSRDSSWRGSPSARGRAASAYVSIRQHTSANVSQ